MSTTLTCMVLAGIAFLLLLEIGAFVYLVTNTTYDPTTIGGVISVFVAPTMTAVLSLIIHPNTQQRQEEPKKSAESNIAEGSQQ